MLKFLTDALNILRLRFAPVEHYRYLLPTAFAAFFVLSMVNAGLFAAYIGTPPTVTAALMLCITWVKWLTLALVMQIFLHYKGAPKMNLVGFILLSEFLNVPLIAMTFLPALAVPALAWQFWALFVQVRGLIGFARISPWWLAAGYLIYFIAASLIGMLVFSFFIANGWIDAEAVAEHMRTMQQTGLPQNSAP